MYVYNIYKKQPPLQDFAKLLIKVLRVFFVISFVIKFYLNAYFKNLPMFPFS